MTLHSVKKLIKPGGLNEKDVSCRGDRRRHGRRGRRFVNVLTDGTSGVYYPLGVALTKIYADKIVEARTTVQSTKASVENLNLL